jgi:outer membrane receptor protein involved in Fe transport
MNRRITLARLSAVATALAVVVPPVAWSQDDALEEIVVTARKRDESVFEIPISVTAFSQDAVDQLGVNTLEGLSGFTPGFTFQNVGAGGRGGRQNPNIRFRGIGVQQASPASRAGAVFWEGSYISDGAGILPLMDLQRVEVIKGPQTAFFGRNTFAGAVNYIPQLPGDELNGKVSLSYSGSDEDSYNAQIAVGGPITDTIGVRVALMSETVGADYQYGNGDPAGEEENQAATFVATWEPTDEFLLKATGFIVESEDTRMLQSQVAPVAAGSCNKTFSGTYRNVATGQDTGTFTTDLSQSSLALFCGTIPDWDEVQPNLTQTGSPTDSTTRFFLAPPLDSFKRLPAELGERDLFTPFPDGFGTNYRGWRYQLSLDYDMGNDHTFHAAYARGESVSRNLFDNNFGTLSPIPPFIPLPNGPWYTGITTWVQDTYAEARVSSGVENRLRYTVGASLYENKADTLQYPAFIGAPLPLNREQGENFGVFGSLDFDINDRFTLSLEGRWNEDKQTVIYDGPADGPAPGALTGLVQKYSAFMPRLILAYRPSEDINLYGSYSQSYLQGIFTNADDYAAANPGSGLDASVVGQFTPRQELRAIEVGIKHRATDWLNYSLAAYVMDWDNQTFFELSPQTFVALNIAGDSEYFGLDAEFEITPNDWFTLTGGLAYVDVEFTDFAATGSVTSAVLTNATTVNSDGTTGGVLTRPGDQISAVGLRPRYIPEWTASFSAMVAIGELINTDKNVWARLDGVYTGDFYVDNLEWNEVAGYWKFNLRAGMDVTENLTAELYGNNLTDDQSWTTAGGTTSIAFGTARKTFGPLPRRREIGLKLTFEF